MNGCRAAILQARRVACRNSRRSGVMPMVIFLLATTSTAGLQNAYGAGGSANGVPIAPHYDLPARSAGGQAPTLLTDAPSPVSSQQPMADTTQVRLSRPCPYVNQVYDTPDDFDGDWACGATSAIMGIQYFNILPNWDVTCSTPYSHVSHFGQYVSGIYTYNNHTYNIGSPDPLGHIAYGGYGYIVRDNWADTRDYMADYFNNHGIPSSVDWSPTWSKLQAEINADHPVVLLTSLTSAGHYVLAIGYFTNQHTAIFNDPYGNKNTGYLNYAGAGACYDWPWPGENNGFQNLNKVSCFIDCRGGWPPSITQNPADIVAGSSGTATFSVQVTGLAPISYRWQKNDVNLSTGGHYSGTATSTLTISPVSTSDIANFRCVVTNTYGNSTSSEARLSVTSSDFDHDGDVDMEDFGKLQACLGIESIAQNAPGCVPADLNANGVVDASDFNIFQGCFRGPDPNVTLPVGCTN